MLYNLSSNTYNDEAISMVLQENVSDKNSNKIQGSKNVYNKALGYNLNKDDFWFFDVSMIREKPTNGIYDSNELCNVENFTI